jgi:glutamate dehydrogenase
VTYDNFLQAQIITQEHVASPHRLDGYEDLMQSLEESGLLDRSIERLPASDLMTERGRSGAGMATPELAVLLAYAKRQLANELLASDLPDAATFQADLLSYFPVQVVERFRDLVTEHPLRRELIATVVANEVINSEGVTFVGRLSEETGADAPSIVRAYRIARMVTDAGRYWAAIEELEGKISTAVQHELMTGVDDLVEATARWYLMRGQTQAMPLSIERSQEAFAELADGLPWIGAKEWVAEREVVLADLVALGVPETSGRRHAYRRALVHAPDIIELASMRHLAINYVARLSFCIGSMFHLDTIGERLAELPRTDRWQRAAARTVADDVLRLRRHLIERVVDDGVDGAQIPDPAAAVAAYIAKHSAAHERLLRLMRSVALEGTDDVAALVVAVRRMESLVG